ncbi:MAG: hypothetical protein JNM68_07465 [Dinghuibacter sp.]|nr:hypothetical protein [Dinghuibacter sp.]
MKRTCYLFTVIFFLYSCNAPRYVYSPSLTHSPMFTHAGEGNAVATVSSNSVGNGVGINLAAGYSPVKHVGAGVQYYSTNDNNKGYDDGIGGRPPQISLRYNRSMAQAQVFFYTPMGEQEKVFAELGLGGGAGKYKINDTQTDTLNGTVRNFYLRAGARHLTMHGAVYGLLDKKGLSRAGVSLRVNNVRFNNINTTYTAAQLNAYRLDSLTFQSITFLEPALTAQFGFPSLPGLIVFAQAGLSFKMNGPLFDNRNSHISIGAGYRLGRKKKNTE